MLDQLVAAEHDETPEFTSHEETPGKSASRAERRRVFRRRRRNHGSKTYGSSREDVEHNSHTSVSLHGIGMSTLSTPLSAVSTESVVYTEEVAYGDEIVAEYYGGPVGLPEPDDTFDGGTLLTGDEELIEFFDELPPGFHLDDEGRHMADAGSVRRRHFELVRLQRAAETEPDWGDPEDWDMGRYEPQHLIVRAI